MITKRGEKYLLSSLEENKKAVIRDIAFGNGKTEITKHIEKLGNEKIRKKPLIDHDFNYNKMSFIIETNADEINGINEVGLFNADNDLIFYDTFADVKVEDANKVKFEYVVSFSTEERVDDWKKIKSLDFLYYTRIKRDIKNVYEEETGAGYVPLKEPDEVESIPGTYHYDVRRNLLYIHTSTDESPDRYTIMIQSY